MISTRTPRRGTRAATSIVLATLFTLACVTTGWTSGGVVMPASATPYGYSLQDMATAVAPFTRSGNDVTHYPDTPFQVLYVTDIDVTAVGAGILATGNNAFSVSAGTSFYVPVFNVNDAPPVLGQFPTTSAGAASYFFDQSQYGGRGFEVVVDGASRPLDAAYLTGPVPVAGEETNVITLGVFVARSVPDPTRCRSGAASSATWWTTRTASRSSRRTSRTRSTSPQAECSERR